MSEFGEAMARYRIEAGLNQRELGAAIGLDPTQVNKVERGHRPPLGAKYMKPLVRVLRLNQSEAKKLVQLAGLSPKVLEVQDEVQTPVNPRILIRKDTQPDIYGRRTPPEKSEDRTSPSSKQGVVGPGSQQVSSFEVADSQKLRRRRGGALAADPIEEPPPDSQAVEGRTVGQDIDEVLDDLSQEERDRLRGILVPLTRQLVHLAKLNTGG
jgi:transcriptional regulator with XRE-family HTH domain